MPPRQRGTHRKRGLSQTEAESTPDGNSFPIEETIPPTSAKTPAASRPVKRGRARTIIDDNIAEEPLGPDTEEPAPQPEDTRRYPTRNPGRRPGMHVGLNWQQEQRQQQAEAATKAMKKKERDLQQAGKARQAEHLAQGIKHIAELEEAREAEDLADHESLQARTAAGYHMAAKATAGAQNLRTSDSGSEFEEEDEGQGDDMDEEEEDEELEDEVVHTKPKSKSVQRRGQKRVQIRMAIDTARPAKPAHSIKTAKDVSNASTRPDDVFNNSYRKTLLERSQSRTPGTLPPSDLCVTVGRIRTSNSQHVSNLQSPRDDRASSPQPQSTPRVAHSTQRTPATVDLHGLRIRATPSTPTPSGSRARAPSRTSDPDGDMNIWDFEGGIREDDGASRTTVAVSRERGRPPKTIAIVNVQPHRPVKAKGPTRRPAHEMPPSKSLSALNLPDDLYVFYENKLMPTCIDIFGGFTDPWNIKPATPKDPQAPKLPSLLDVITLLVNEFHHDGEKHVLEEHDLIYRVTRQRLMNWRNGFLGRALTVVKEGEKAFIARVKIMTGKKATSADVKAWADAAIKSNGGEAWYQQPATAENDKARGMFTSLYMLRTFAPHLAVIRQSYFEESKPQLGALAMATAAVETAFRCYTGNGTYQAPEGDFDKVGGGGLTEKWVRGGVTNLYNNRHRWDEMMAAAQEMSETRVGRTRNRNIKNVDPYERDVVPPSSSPPRPM